MKILCDTHSHTVASTHAYSTVHDYFQWAKNNGLELFSITDHAPSMPDAPHMWHFGNMKILPREINGVVMLRGIEANIIDHPFPGTANRFVDLPDGVLPFLDFAIASLHEPVFTPKSEKDNTQAMIRAMESGVIQIIGHPGNPNYPVSHREVVAAAKANNVLLEINNSSFVHSRSGSKPICTQLIEEIMRQEWKISLGSDAHVAFHVGLFDEAIAVLESLNFPQSHIVTQHPQRFLSFLTEHGKLTEQELSAWLRQLS